MRRVLFGLLLVVLASWGGAVENYPAPAVSFRGGPVLEYSLAALTPGVRVTAPIVVQELSFASRVYRSEPEFFPQLYREPQYTTREFMPPATISDRGKAVVQALGTHLYGYLASAGQVWEGGAGTLNLPVRAAGEVALTATLVFCVPTTEQIAARSVIVEHGAYRRATSAQEALTAAANGMPVLFYLGRLATNQPTGEEDAVTPLPALRLTVPLTVHVQPRPAPDAMAVTAQLHNTPVWYYDGAWVFHVKDGSAALLRGTAWERWPAVAPGFFAVVTPEGKYNDLLFAADQPAYLRHFPNARIVSEPGATVLHLPTPMTARELLALSAQWNGTEYYLSAVRGVLALCGKPAPLPADAATTQAKINALGVLDDTLPYEQRPEDWLYQRRGSIIPRLIAGLIHPERRVAEGCLRLLADAPESPELVTALVRLAEQAGQPLQWPATLALTRFPSDPRARKLLETAVGATLTGEQRDALVSALGRAPAAVAALAPALLQHDALLAPAVIEQLAAQGIPDAIAPLERVAKGATWRTAAAAHLALARLDPQGHALTADQQLLLLNTGQYGFKVAGEYFQQRQRMLASLRRDEVRPLVLDMLRTDDAQSDALGILARWQDREALPEITRMITAGENNWRAGELFTTYFEIADSPQAVDDLLRLRKGSGDLDDAMFVRALLATELPTAHKLAMLRRVRETLGKTNPSLVAQQLRWAGEEMPELLRVLMADEHDLVALGWYAEAAGADPDRRCSGELRHAVETLAAQTPKSKDDTEYLYTAERILTAAATCGLQGVDGALDTLMESPLPLVKLEAGGVAVYSVARRRQGLRLLYDGLASHEVDSRRQAAQFLTLVHPLDTDERQQREALLLTFVGTLGEDYALRLLTTCGGPAAIRALTPLLDDRDLQRGIYAAWVLAQLPDAAVARRAQRRLGLCGLFHHYVAQQSGGIAFLVAPELYFSQTTGELNQRYDTGAARALALPVEALLPTKLDAAEQQFVIGAYRQAWQTASGGLQFPSEDFLAMRQLDASYVALLLVIAAEDPWLDALHVQGNTVAHFIHRQQATQTLARLTGQKATYRGLAGEPLDSTETPPTPYTNQNIRIAHYLLDLIQQAKLTPKPQNDAEWNRVNFFNTWLGRLRDAFGDELKDAIKTEAAHRTLTGQLREAGLEWWR